MKKKLVFLTLSTLVISFIDATQGGGDSGDNTSYGDSSVANAMYSSSFGYNAKAESTYSTALGTETHSTGYGSTSVGNTSWTTGDYSVAIGSYLNSDNNGTTVFQTETKV